MSTRPNRAWSASWGPVAAMATAALPVEAPAAWARAQVVSQLASPPPTHSLVGHSALSGSRWGGAAADAVSRDADGSYAADKDPGSLFTVDPADRSSAERSSAWCSTGSW
jgi:hypothetical protein